MSVTAKGICELQVPETVEIESMDMECVIISHGTLIQGAYTVWELLLQLQNNLKCY